MLTKRFFFLSSSRRSLFLWHQHRSSLRHHRWRSRSSWCQQWHLSPFPRLQHCWQSPPRGAGINCDPPHRSAPFPRRQHCRRSTPQGAGIYCDPPHCGARFHSNDPPPRGAGIYRDPPHRGAPSSVLIPLLKKPCYWQVCLKTDYKIECISFHTVTCFCYCSLTQIQKSLLIDVSKMRLQRSWVWNILSQTFLDFS